MADEVLVDALPYYDAGYDEPGVRQAALALVEEECRRYKATKNYLDILGVPNIQSFETDIMRKEFERIEKNQPKEMLSMKRYEVPPPNSTKLTEVSAWTECVENSLAQLEHHACRMINLEIMSEYGATAWRIYNQTLQIMFDEAQKTLNKLRKDIQEVNLQRKTEQTYAGEKLRSLEKTWVGLVSKNYEIECAIVELEKELIELKKTKQQQNAVTLQANESEEQHDQDDDEDEEEPMVNGNNHNGADNSTNSDESN